MFGNYKNILGIEVIDSGKQGCNFGIFAITHGNEKIGLEVFDYLKKDDFLKNKLRKGKVYLIAVNLLAYGKNKRFVDDNMNRIWNKNFKLGSYEFLRKEELQLILDEIDIAIDLHSMDKGEEVYAVGDIKFLEEIKEVIDAPIALVDNMGQTGAMIGYLIRKGKIAFGIECGNHNQKNAYKIGLKNVLNLLVYYDLIDGKIENDHTDKKLFKFWKEIYPQTDKFKFVKDYNGFEFLKEGEIYAIDGDKKYIAEEDCYIGLVCKKPNGKDGCGFLFKEIKD